MNTTKNITILLTGGTGFLGSHLLLEFVQQDYHVILLKRSTSNTKRISKILPNIVSYDIDQVELDSIFAQHTIDIIVHTAVEYGKKDESCATILETNLLFPIRLVELAIKYNVKTFINTDSYFNKEHFSYNYLLNYSLSKKSILLWLKNFSSKIQVFNLVLEHIFGENDNNNKFVSAMINQIAIDKRTSVDITYGHQKRDFIYVKDVTSAFVKVIEYALTHKTSYRSFNVGLGASVSIHDFISKIKEISSSKTILNFGAISYREDEIMLSIADNKDLLDIGWIPKYCIDEGLKQTIDAARRKDVND